MNCISDDECGRMIVAMNQARANRLVLAVGIVTIVLTAYFLYSTPTVEVPVQRERKGLVALSSSNEVILDPSLTNLTVRIDHDESDNTTRIQGITEMHFIAGLGSRNLSYVMTFLYLQPWHVDYTVNASKKVTLISDESVVVRNMSDYMWGFLVYEENYLRGNFSFNNTVPSRYLFQMSWDVTLSFVNVSPLKAEFACNISFIVLHPDYVAVLTPDSSQFVLPITLIAWFIVISKVIKKESRIASDSSVEVGNN